MIFLDRYEDILVIGATAKSQTTVNQKNTARAIHSGSIDVFSTPMMIALMESAAYECIQPHLPDGVTSLGITVNIEHTAGSPIDASIEATAVITGISGRRVEFDVYATSSTGGSVKEIGRGKHTRAIVTIEKFLSKL